VEEAKTVARAISSIGIKSIAIDTERNFINFGLVKQICSEMGGKYFQLEALRAAPIASIVRGNLFAPQNS
jgi:Mg-chelatase subunit ChlD